jgi:GT2 family glycosyltransferase
LEQELHHDSAGKTMHVARIMAATIKAQSFSNARFSRVSIMHDNTPALDRDRPTVPIAQNASRIGIRQSGVERSLSEVIHAGQFSSSAMRVSVVVPSCGRPHLLRQCLNSLLDQDFDHASYEIIIVDDGPHPATREVVVECAAQGANRCPRLEYIASLGPHGPAAARNYGWRAAHAPIIAFTDDDTIASCDWLRKGLQSFAPEVKAVWGRIYMPLDGTPTDYERDAKGLETAEFVTANCFCLKAALEQIDGFDERFRFAWREDADLYFRLLALGGRIVHAPDALITHPIRPAAWGISLRQQKKILFDALLYKKHPALYRQKIRAGARWDYYLIVACLITFAGAVSLDHAIPALAAGGIWLLLTLRFFAMRLSGTVKTVSHIAEMLATSALIPPIAVFWRMVGAIKFRVALI